jgi:hypothetical protein
MAYLAWLKTEDAQAELALEREQREQAEQAQKIARELAEQNNLTKKVEGDIRTAVLTAVKEENRREIYANILALRSSERVGMNLVWATWCLALFRAALVGATVGLIVVTLNIHN